MVENAIKNARSRRKNNNEFRKQYASQLKVEKCSIPSEETFTGNCFKKSIFDSKWKKQYDSDELTEREHVAQIKAAEKAKRVAPAFNKGSYQYITDNADLETLGRKI